MNFAGSKKRILFRKSCQSEEKVFSDISEFIIRFIGFFVLRGFQKLRKGVGVDPVIPNLIHFDSLFEAKLREGIERCKLSTFRDGCVRK